VTLEPLSGFTVAVIADQCREELVALLERQGARVVLAPALRIVPLGDDAELRATTMSLLERPPDVVVASAEVELRGWIEAAEGWGLGQRLRAALGCAYVVSRDSGDTAVKPGRYLEIREHLLDRGVAGERVAVQVYGEPQPELYAALVEAGAEVVEVFVHRWLPPPDPAPLRRLVDLATNQLVDAVAFTSAPTVGALLSVAGDELPALLGALRTDVVAACMGQHTAAPLLCRGIPVVAPRRPKLGAMVRDLVDELPRRAPTLRVAGQEMTLRGHAAVVDGALRPLAPAPMAVLRALAAAPGRVLSRAALLTALPRGADEHAVEMAVARLRAALGGSAYVQTVVKRGYRLRVD
jgi:uroporphyrinogen-III synthase